jgi:Ca2+:H+ antiporter
MMSLLDRHGLSWRSLIDPRRVGWLRLLLAFVPATIVAEFLEGPRLLLFALSALAILPLAGQIGAATETVAERLGPGIGGLLNATFGNAAELIISLFALAAGLDGVVKASITGNIIGNVLLVLGASLLAGGIRYSVQSFNRTAAGVGATLMVLAAVAMLIPAVFHRLVGAKDAYLEHKLSLAVSVALILAYILSLLFSLVTHRDLYNPGDPPNHQEEPLPTAQGDRMARPGLWKPVTMLLVSTGLVAWMSEILVGTVAEASEALGMTQVFVGVFVVAIVGNAAEHSTAVWMALKNQMDLAVGIALGSALQIALFVAPVLVFASYLRPEPLDLLFTPLEVAAMFLSVLIAYMVAEDGESNWLEGAMLLLIYAILGMAFFFLPRPAAGHAGDRPHSISRDCPHDSLLPNRRHCTGFDHRDGACCGQGVTPRDGTEGPRQASRDMDAGRNGSRGRGRSRREFPRVARRV